MKFGSYEVSTGKVVAAILAAGSVTIGAVFFTSYARFAATTAPTGEAGKTYIWHDLTKDKLMADVAASGAKYFVMSETSDVGGGGGLSGLTTNKVTKATAADAIGNSSISDDGTNVTTTENVLIDSDTAKVKLGDGQDVQLGRAEAAALGLSNATGSDAIRLSASGRWYGNAVTVTVSATASHHTTDGTTVSIRATAHGLAAGQVILLAGWTWSDGGGVINGYHRVTSITDANNFVLTPGTSYSTAGALLVCPTNATNPSVVGTVTVQARVGLGAALTQPMDEAIAFGGKTVLEKNGIATTSTDGLVLKNATSATVGTTVQYSPRLRWRGQSWDTDGSNDTWDWWIEVIPASAATTTSGLKFYNSKNGAAGTNSLTLESSGNLTGTAGTMQNVGVTATSQLRMTGGALTTGTMTATQTGQVRTCWHQYSWTNAMVVALGAVTSGDITVATLPAKTKVTQVYVVVTGQGVLAGATLTGQVGTDATFSNYIAAGDLKAAANTVYGDANAECGASLPGGGLYVGHLPSWTGTTAVKLRVITDGAGGAVLSGVTGSTGTVIICTEVMQ